MIKYSIVLIKWKILNKGRIGKKLSTQQNVIMNYPLYI